MLSETISKFEREVEKFIKVLDIVYEEYNRIDWSKVPKENREHIYRRYNKIVENIERILWELNYRWRLITEEHCMMVRLKEGESPYDVERACLASLFGEWY